MEIEDIELDDGENEDDDEELVTFSPKTYAKGWCGFSLMRCQYLYK